MNFIHKLILILFVCMVCITPSVSLADTPDASVVVLQKFLEAKGLLKLSSSDTVGYFGPKTKKALTVWQESVGLPANGVFGRLTRNKLASVTEASPNTSSQSDKVLPVVTQTPVVAATSTSNNFVTVGDLTAKLQAIQKMIADSQRINQLTNTNIVGGTISGATLSNVTLTGSSNGTSGGGGGTWGSILGALSDQIDLITALSAKVSSTTTINGHALSNNVVVSASDITTGTLPSAQLPSPNPSAIGGVQAKDCSSGGQLIQKINVDGSVTCAAPAANVITFAQGPLSSIPTCNSTLNEVYYVADSFGSGSSITQANCLTGASSWTYLMNGHVVNPIIPGDWTTLGTGGTRTDLASSINIWSSVSNFNQYGITTAITGDYTKNIILYIAPSSVQFGEVWVGWTDGTKSEGCGPLNIGGIVGIDGMADSQLTGNNYANANGGATGKGQSFSSGLLYVQLVKSGTHLTCSVSYDQGVSYFTIFNDTTPYLTPTGIAIGADPRNGATKTGFTLISY